METSEFRPNKGFKRKTIVKAITSKIENWLKSIEDENLRKEVGEHYIVTGGAITSMLLGQNPNDYDLYIDNTSTAEKLAKYYLSKIPTSDNYKDHIREVKVFEGRVSIFIKSAGLATVDDNQKDYRYFEMEGTEQDQQDYFEKFDVKTKEKYVPILISSNAITLSSSVQIILRFVGPAQEIHKNYDFLHCTNYYTPTEGLVLNQKALESIMCKELKYVGSLYPICSMFRIKKFIKRGWTITAGEMLKIAYDINKLNLNDINVLRDQLTGVDAAYFLEVINILRKENTKELDRTYLFDTINRVFDEADEEFNYGDDE
jgi:hypothetical protein